MSSYTVCHVIRADGLVFDGWAYSALFRRRWLTVNGRFTQARNKRSVRQIARWRAGADTDAADAVLAGVGLGLLAVGAGETALAVLPEHAMSAVSEAVAAGAPRLPGPLAPARPRLDVLTLIQAGSTEPDHDHYVYRSAFPADLLREAAADASSLPLLSHLVTEVVRAAAVEAAKRPPADLNGTTDRSGFTCDFSLTSTGQGVGAFVRTNCHGEPIGPAFTVALPELTDNVWGETATVLLAHLYAARAGQSGPFYTDSTGVIRRLTDFQILRTYTWPPLVARILKDPAFQALAGIDVRWVPRSTTQAQIAADHAAREASRTPGAALAIGTRELVLPGLLRPPRAGARDRGI